MKKDNKPTRDLFRQYKARYPHLDKKSAYIYKNGNYHISILTKEKTFYIWINEEQDGFIVGLDWLHTHFDYHKEEKRPAALAEAFAKFDNLLQGKDVALYDAKSKNIRCLTSKEEAIRIMQEEPNQYYLQEFIPD